MKVQKSLSIDHLAWDFAKDMATQNHTSTSKWIEDQLSDIMLGRLIPKPKEEPAPVEAKPKIKSIYD